MTYRIFCLFKYLAFLMKEFSTGHIFGYNPQIGSKVKIGKICALESNKTYDFIGSLIGCFPSSSSHKAKLKIESQRVHMLT